MWPYKKNDNFLIWNYVSVRRHYKILGRSESRFGLGKSIPKPPTTRKCCMLILKQLGIGINFYQLTDIFFRYDLSFPNGQNNIIWIKIVMTTNFLSNELDKRLLCLIYGRAFGVWVKGPWFLGISKCCWRFF